MALVYFDSSALVKLVVNEIGSDIATTLWNQCDAALSSRLAYPEVCAALAAAGRNHDLTESETSAVTAQWHSYWTGIRPVELTSSVELHAGTLAQDYALRGADAVHLASVFAIGVSGLTVAVWDRRLHAATTAAGFAVAPATIA